MSPQILATRLDEIEVRESHWLWPGLLPLGKLTLIDGDPDQGKSFMSLDLAARLSVGSRWPDGAAIAEPGHVVLVNCEDPLRDTVLPRLIQLGAARERIVAFQGFSSAGKLASLPVFPRDVDALRALVERSRARLVIVDPLMAFIDPMFATINDQAIRQALMPLIQMADETQCALLAIRHLNKNGTGRAIYRGSGSIGIVGCSRCAYLVGRSPDDASLRVLACLKSNIGPAPAALGFRILHLDRLLVEWAGVVEYSAEDLVGTGGKKTTALERAVAFLRTQLQEGPIDHELLLARARGANISDRTLRRAKEVVGVRMEEEGPARGRRHYCSLEQPSTVDAILASNPTPAV